MQEPTQTWPWHAPQANMDPRRPLIEAALCPALITVHAVFAVHSGVTSRTSSSRGKKGRGKKTGISGWNAIES